MALYDLAGKQLKKPVWQLLGGAVQDAARPYATIYVGDTRGEPTRKFLDGMVKVVEQVRALGVTGMKIPLIGFTELSDRELVGFLSECRNLVGDDVVLSCDAGYRWSHWQEALWVMNRLDDLRIYFMETPLQHDDIEGHRKLARMSPILIGAGEFSTGRRKAKEWLDRADISLLHVGISRGGGFTELSRIAAMCEMAGALLMPHSYASGISDMANVHFQIAHKPVPMVEFRMVEPVTSILRRDLVSPNKFDFGPDGMVAPPTGPGLGLELGRPISGDPVTSFIHKRCELEALANEAD